MAKNRFEDALVALQRVNNTVEVESVSFAEIQTLAEIVEIALAISQRLDRHVHGDN